MVQESETKAAETTSKCPNGDRSCPGPKPAKWDWDRYAPCFDCYAAGLCPNGRAWCANRGEADGEGEKCRLCQLQRGGKRMLAGL